MIGYVRGYRSRFDHPLFSAQEFCRGYAWDWLCANAAFRDHQIDVGGKIVKLKRGQLCHSIRYLGNAWKWDKSRVWRYVKRLEAEAMIETTTETGRLVITICNYDKYQRVAPKVETANNTPTGTEARRLRDKEEDLKGKDISSYEDSKNPATNDISEAVLIYNSFANDAGWPKIQKLTKQRKTRLLSRLNEVDGIDGWRLAIEKASASHFLTGKTINPFFASFDWLTKQSNFYKLMEGNYDNRTNSPSSADPYPESAPISFAARTRRPSQEHSH